MGSGGMRRKGRRHLPKVPGEVSSQLGFQYSAWTPPGQIERAGAFARGLRADSPESRRRFRTLGLAFLAIVIGGLVVLPLLVRSL